MRTGLGNDTDRLLFTLDVEQWAGSDGTVSLTYHWGRFREEAKRFNRVLRVEDLAQEGYISWLARDVAKLVAEEVLRLEKS